MGQSFTYPVDELSKIQWDWVPREQDVNGGGQQGGRLVMLTYGESVLFDGLAIADTTAHMSIAPSGTNPSGTPYDQVYAVCKTALVVSTLNESVSLQPMWSRDRVNWYAFGSATTVAASSGTAQSTAIALSTATQYIPYVGLQATCATAPTSGTLSAWLERLG
jgi:hypothetical protein